MAKERIKSIFVGLDGTSKCNRNCSHCFTRSCTKNVKHFTPRMAHILVKELRRYEDIKIVINGGGEPLLNPYLAEVMDILAKLKCTFRIVTSGILPNEMVEKRQLRSILKKHGKPGKLDLIISFNLFGSHFPERMKNTLPFIMKNSKISRLALNVCCHSGNILETHDELESVFDELKKNDIASLEPFLAYSGSSPIICDDRFNWKQWSERIDNFLQNLAHLYPSIYFLYMHDWKRFCTISIDPFFVIIQGRAKDSIKKALGIENFHCEIFENDPFLKYKEKIHVTYDGNFQTTCACPRSEATSLGKLGDISLFEALHHKKELADNMTKHLLLDRRSFRPDELCTMCQYLKAEHFDF